jgi:hypothetical protein
LALTLALGLSVAGCGSKSTPTAQTHAAPVKKAAGPAVILSPYLVGAVVTGKAGASLLQVKFELSKHPDVGDPVDVDLVFIPQGDNVEHFSGTIQGEDGFDVVDGGTFSTTEKPTFGNPIHHTLKVLAKRDGIFALTVSLSVQSGGESLAPVYSMPIIAGNGFADTGSAPAAAANAPKPAPAAAAQ